MSSKVRSSIFSPNTQLTQSIAVTKLNDVRDDNTTCNNRLDTLLADVFSLLSLFYLTIGKTRDTPATYCQIASMRVSYFVFQLRFLLHRPFLPPDSNFMISILAIFQIVYSRDFSFFPTCQQILNHMNESALYNEPDLTAFHRRLNELRQIVQQDSKQPKALTKLLERQLHECGMSFSIVMSQSPDSNPFSFHN